MSTIAMEEYELMKDSKYRVYVSAVDKALKNFDYTSEWADLISALGKLNKVLMGHQKFPVIPRRIKISKRLAQCMHPALPSGVHLKALETYDIIFRCMGTNRLSHELFIYSAGLFPLLAHAAMNVRPSLLTVYETHFVPLGERLRPGLSGFLSGVLPGLEEGSDHFQRANCLLEKVCDGVGPAHFHGCLWDCVAANSAIRLPAISFVLAHFNRKLATEDQKHVMGTNLEVMAAALCGAARDSSVLVQRSALDLLLVGFPIHTTLLPRSDVARLVQAALAAVLRRDMSLNRRLFAWLLGTEVNLSLLPNDHPLVLRSKTDGSASRVSLYFELYSRETLEQAIRTTLSEGLGKSPHDLRPYRLLVSLLDKPDIGPVILDSILCDVFRALYLETGGCPTTQSCQELVKCANLLFSTLEPSYIWQHCATLLEDACKRNGPEKHAQVHDVGSGKPGLFETCLLTGFLLDAVSVETHPETPGQHLPGLFRATVDQLTAHSSELGAQHVAATLRLATKILSRVARPDPPAPATPPPEPKPLLLPGENQSEVADRTRANSDLSEYKHNKAKSKMKKSKTAESKMRLSSGWERELVDSSPVLLTAVFNTSESPAERTHLSVASLCSPPSPTVEHSQFTEPDAAVTIAVPTKEQAALAQCQRQFQSCFIAIVGQDSRTLNNKCDQLYGRLLAVRPRETLRERTEKLERLLHRCINPAETAETNELLNEPAKIGVRPETDVLDIFPEDGISEISEPVSVACSLLVQLSAFPTFAPVDNDEASLLPPWLQVLLSVACYAEAAPGIQLTATRTLLDLLGQARERPTGTSTGIVTRKQLRFIEGSTTAVSTLSQSLWRRLGQSDVYQTASVELLLNLHSTVSCDDVESVLGQALSSECLAERTDAFRRFQTLWHVGRDVGNVGKHHRTLDKALLKTLDTLLTTETSPLKLQAQSWLLHSLVRGDTPRILDPLLSILLDSTTARMSVLHVNVQSTANTSQDCEDAKIFAISSEEGNVIYHVHSNKAANYTKTVRAKRIFAVRSLVDRSTRHFVDENKNMSLFVNPFVTSEDEAYDFLTESGVKDRSEVRKVKSEVRINEKSEAASKLGSGLADDKTGGLELESMTRWSSGELEMSTPAEEFFDSSTNVAESIIEDILTAVVKKCERNKLEREERTTLGFHPIHQHMLLYCGVYDSNRTLYALQALRSVMVTNARMFLCCAATTGLAGASGSSHLIGLLARHRKCVFGKSFTGEVASEFCAPYRSSMYLEVVVSVCLYFARSFYPNLGQMRLTPEEIAGNRQVQLASAELLTLATAELAQVVRDGGKGCASYVADMLARCKVNKIALHCLDSSVHCMRDMQAESPRTFTEEIVGFNDPAPEPSPSKCRHQGSEHSEGFQVQLLRLVLSLIMLEHQVNVLKNPDGADSSANSNNFNGKQLRYLPGVPIPQQPMFLASVLTALQLKHCRHLHQHWNVLVTSALPFMGSSLLEIVIRVSTQLCENLESLAASYLTHSHGPECCRPADFAATQLEALTALTHFCLLGNAGNASVLGSSQGQVIGNLLSVFMPSMPNMAQPNLIQDVASLKDKTTLSEPHLSARRSALGNLPRVVACIALLWEAVGSNADTREAGKNVLGSHRVVKQQLLELLSPISLHHGVNFLAAVAVVWHQRRPSSTQRKVIPVPSPRQQVLVSLVAAIRVLPMDTLVQTVHQVVKQPLQVNNNANESAASLEASVLELFYAHVLAGTHQLAESWPSLLGLLRDGLTLTPPAQFLMLAILNQFIQRCPPLPDKKDQRDLQDITAKLVESCSAIAGSCLQQTTWLRRNLAVREEDLSVTGTKPENGTSSLSQYSVQAQAVLAELLAPLMDVSYGCQETERVVSLLASLMANIVPYLRNHTARNASSYLACVKLLSSLSGFPYMRKAWRRDAMDLLLEPPFFRMQPECLPLWRNVVDNLMTHDTTTFRELMNKLSVSQGTGLSIFSSREAEYEVRAQLLKRLAFVVLCSETDQYQKHMPEIQERLADSLRLPQVIPGVQAAVFLCCRVLLLRMSPQHVTSLWPVIISEMVQVFLHIEQELSTDTDQFSSHIRLMSALDSSWVVNASNGLAAHGHPHWAQLQLAAGKLLDIALLLPAQQLPQFQMYRWAFVGCADAGLTNNDDDAARSSDFVPHVVRIARLMDAKYACPFVPLSVPPGQPLLTAQTIGSLRDLRPFFAALASRSNERSNLEKPQFLLEKLEQVVELDFLEAVPQR